MARIRTIKPGFWTHEGIFDAEQKHNVQFQLRIAYGALINQVDKQGRFEWRPRQLKLGIMPYDNVDFEKLLDILEQEAFIKSYVVDGKKYGAILSFKKHQCTNKHEAESTLPVPPWGEVQCMHHTSIVHAPYSYSMEREEEREREGEINIYNLNSIGNSRVVADRKSEIFIKIPLKGRGYLSVTKLEIAHWQKIHPLINIQESLNKICEYYTAQPKKRRTLEEMQQRINSWLGEDQAKAEAEAKSRSKKHATTTTRFKSHADEVRDMQLEYRAREKALANARSA